MGVGAIKVCNSTPKVLYFLPLAKQNRYELHDLDA